eukprot:9057031-Alexandrium_andersonii.AAC.1
MRCAASAGELHLLRSCALGSELNSNSASGGACSLRPSLARRTHRPNRPLGRTARANEAPV